MPGMKNCSSFRLFTVAVSLLLMLAACDSPQQKEAKYLQRGNNLFAKGEYEKARVEYKNAARYQPTDAEPAYRLGLVAEAQSDFRTAFTLYAAAEQQNKNFYPAVLKVAQYYMAAEIYPQAHKRVEQVLGQDPENAEGHAIYAALLLREKNYSDAEKEAKQALAKDPANISACSALTGIYSTQNLNEKALAAINDGINHNPDNVALLMLRVLLYQHQDNMPKVAEAYETVFALKPKDAHFRIELAELYIAKNQLDDAETTLRKGITALPDDWAIKHQLIVFLSTRRTVEAAEGEIKHLMTLYPDHDEPYFWLADLYATHNDAERAVALLGQIVARAPSAEPALNAQTMLARINIKRGDKNLAEKLVNAVLAQKPDNREALFIRASMEFDGGYYQNTVSDLRTLLGNAPKDQDALQLLAETLLAQGHLDLAIDTLKRLVDISPSNFPARVRLAQIVGLHGDNKQAIEMIGLVTKAVPDYEPGWETTARLAIADKQWLVAEAAIQVLDKLKDQHATALFLQGQIQQNNGVYEQAISKYSDAINVNPAAPIAEYALSELMKCYQANGHVAAAVSYLETLKIDTPYISTLLGAAYATVGAMDKAAAALDHALASRPAFPQPYIERAKLYIEAHKPDAAIDVLKISLQITPGDVRAPMMAADLLSTQGRYQEAIGLYEDILTRNPEYAAAANNLAEVIADYQFNDVAALEKARQAADRFSNSKDPLLLDTLAWVYYRQGNLPQAQTIMERAMAQTKSLPPQLHYHYGTILMKAGKLEAAKAELRQAVTTTTAYPGLDEARILLK